MTVIRLTYQEIILGAMRGVMQQVSSMKHNRQPRYGMHAIENAWEYSILGALGEQAISKFLNRFWAANDYDPKQNDVDGFEVRTTVRKEGCLILHNEDKDDRYYFLVIAAAPLFTLAGAIKCRDGKQQRFWRESTGRPAYFIPQADLIPVDVLMREGRLL